MTTLAYTPFLQPLPLHDWWWFTLIPMAWFISMAYKGVRLREPTARLYWRAVAIMTVQIVLGLVALAIGLYVFTDFLVPWYEG